MDEADRNFAWLWELESSGGYTNALSRYIAARESYETLLEMERVKQAMMALSPSERKVVRLRFMAQLSSKEVAAVMHKSDGAVRQMQSSAIAKLKKLLGEQAR